MNNKTKAILGLVGAGVNLVSTTILTFKALQYMHKLDKAELKLRVKERELAIKDAEIERLNEQLESI